MGRLAAYSVLVSSGTLLAAIGLGHPGMIAGALFYLVSSTLTIAAFFLLIELVERGRDAGADVLAVTMEAYGDADEDEEEEVVGAAIPGTMAILGLCRSEDVVGGVVVRQEKAYPVYDDDYAAHVDTMRREFDDRYPTLHMVGRNGMHRYNNQDHAMMTAMLTVRNIVAGEKLYDIWAVNEDAEYHESGTEGERAALASVRDVPSRVSKAA